MRLLLTTVALVLSIVLSACSSSGDAGDATATVNDFDITSDYFSSVGDAISSASLALNPQPVDDDVNATPGAGAAIAALSDLESDLAALDPPDVAADAHQRLLDATREIIAIGERAETEQPNDATAEAEIVPAIAEFADACLDLVDVSEDADAPVGMNCGVEEEPDASEEPTAPPPPPTAAAPTPDAEAEATP